MTMRTGPLAVGALLAVALSGCQWGWTEKVHCQGYTQGIGCPDMSEPQPDPTEPPVDCLGNGSLCSGSVTGTRGAVVVTGNTDTPWRLHLECSFGGEQVSDVQRPSSEGVGVFTDCRYGARALHWTIHREPVAPPTAGGNEPPCRGDKPGVCP